MNALKNLLTANGYVYNSLFAIDGFCTLWETVHRAYFWDDAPTTDDERKAFSDLYEPLKTMLDMLRKIISEQCKREIETAQAYLVRAIDELKAKERNGATVATAADMVRGKAAEDVGK